jgi:hypothetical protein
VLFHGAEKSAKVTNNLSEFERVPGLVIPGSLHKATNITLGGDGRLRPGVNCRRCGRGIAGDLRSCASQQVTAIWHFLEGGVSGTANRAPESVMFCNVFVHGAVMIDLTSLMRSAHGHDGADRDFDE